MAAEDELISRMVEQAKAMEGLPLKEKRPMDLSVGDLTMIAKGLALLVSVKAAVK